MKQAICGVFVIFTLLLSSVYAGSVDRDIVQLYMVAKDGDAAAQVRLGGMYYYGMGVEQDYIKAVAWFRKAAEQGDDVAQEILGEIYYRGDGVKQDYTQAVFWFTKSAEQGNANAQVALGVAYHNGHGVKQDLSAAKEWYGKACDSGEPAGCDVHYELNKAGVP